MTALVELLLAAGFLVGGVIQFALGNAVNAAVCILLGALLAGYSWRRVTQ